MALAVTVRGGDLSAYLIVGSLTVKWNTVDFTLLDPPTIGIYEWTGILGTSFGPVTVTDASIGLNWSGTLNAVEFRPASAITSGHATVTCTAINTQPPATTSAPFDLSSVLHNPNDIIALENGTDLIVTEDGVYNIQTEGPRAVGYRNLLARAQYNLDGTTTYYGSCQIEQPGMQVGQTFSWAALNSDIFNLPNVGAGGLTGYDVLTVSGVTITWHGVPLVPTYLIEFGSTSTQQTWRFTIQGLN